VFDPHAVARIRARALLDELEQLLLAMRATNTGVSASDIAVVRTLKRRLGWCEGCYYRYRSVAMLLWVLKKVAELVIRVVETSICKVSARMVAHWGINDTWKRYQEA